MSIEVMASVLHHSKATGATLLVALGIANHQGNGGAYPSRAILAKYARCSERYVVQATQQLVDLGELKINYRAGVNGTNVYYLEIACPDDCDRSTNHRQGVNRTSPQVNSETLGGEPYFTSGVNRTSPKPSYNLKLTNTEKSEIEKAREDREQRLRRHEELKAEMRAAAERAVPMPICEHGKKLLKCQQCITALAKEERKEA